MSDGFLLELFFNKKHLKKKVSTQIKADLLKLIDQIWYHSHPL